MPTDTERKYPVSADDPRWHTQIRETRIADDPRWHTQIRETRIADDPRWHTEIRETRTLRQGCLPPAPRARSRSAPSTTRPRTWTAEKSASTRPGSTRTARDSSPCARGGWSSATGRRAGEGPRDGPARTEYEYPVTVADALELLGLCGPRALVKHPHTLPDDWTVDEYAPPHAGLAVPEIEQQGDPTTPPPRPPRAGKDITSDRTYSNATPTTSPSP